MQRGGLDVIQLRDRVIRPVVGFLQLGGDEAAAVELLLGTAAQESGFRFLAQVPSGPALGLFQMEPATLDDLERNFLAVRPELRGRLAELAGDWPEWRLQLATNLAFQVAAARLQYFRQPAALPRAGDVEGHARYWKRYWNTARGKGTEAQFVESWRLLVAPALEGRRA